VNARRVRRAVALVFALSICAVRFYWLRLLGRATLERRALWLQESSRRVVRRLGMTVHVDGRQPARGLVVSNHLGYLDILVLNAAMPCFFVAKKEIEGWPFFGKAAREGGSIFIDRKTMRSARLAADEIAGRLKTAVPVLLFPEGTSTDGAQVLRFRTLLVEPATTAGAPITAASVSYEIEGGAEEREACFFGGATFVPHVWKVLGLGRIHAKVRFGEPRIYADRRTAAEHTHAEVAGMREANAPANVLSVQ
jgi:lyso-ornithine lipid O-acyltransferase